MIYRLSFLSKGITSSYNLVDSLFLLWCFNSSLIHLLIYFFYNYIIFCTSCTFLTLWWFLIILCKIFDFGFVLYFFLLLIWSWLLSFSLLYNWLFTKFSRKDYWLFFLLIILRKRDCLGWGRSETFKLCLLLWLSYRCSHFI